MATKLDEQLDLLTNLVETVGVEGVLQAVVKLVIDNIGYDQLKAQLLAVVDAAVDDENDTGLDEIIESKVKAIAKSRVESVFDRAYQWANK
jgi:hypothetical protein